MQQATARSSSAAALGAATVARTDRVMLINRPQTASRFRDIAFEGSRRMPRRQPGGEPMEINGIAHTILTVGNFAACKAFYEKLLPFLGLRPVMDAETFYYCVGGRTAVGIQPAAAASQGDRFVQVRPGLHHLCFRARERADVDTLYRFLLELGATIVHPPEEGAWAPGYYSVLFEDPDGIRLEMNHVPGKGLLVSADVG
jgi:catechol 2,3-dioxygenase-like lactoylglutathione lyase family enzyme